MVNDITLKIGGQAGFGIITSGTMLAKIASRAGYFVLASNEYPSLIRGGHNVITVRVSGEPFYSLRKNLDILVALNKETIQLHAHELSEKSIVIFDSDDYEWKNDDFPSVPRHIALPFARILKGLGGEAVMRNTIALGATVALVGLDFSLVEGVIRDQFFTKEKDIVAENISAAKEGYEFVNGLSEVQDGFHLQNKQPDARHCVMNASEAMGFGAIAGGMKFAAIYPMTPINALITFFADHAKELGIVYKQPEDEIAGINMAIGASLGGVRSMVATSGGGFALMVEGLSLAGITETPLVIDLGMRPGPATGMPTWTEQGELQFAIHAGHGEFPRIVLAPGDAEEAYRLAVDAFAFADTYQVPVIILTDKYLNENLWCVRESIFVTKVHEIPSPTVREEDLPGDGSFMRYTLHTPDGVSQRSLPGMPNGQYIANSYEHDEHGYTTEDPKMRKQMVEKRLKKLQAIQAVASPPTVYGDADADITFVTYGSTKGPVLEAMRILSDKKIRSKCIHFSWIYPFATDAVKKILNAEKRLVLIECNSTGQLASLIREHTGMEIREKLFKYDGRQFFPEEIVESVINQK